MRFIDDTFPLIVMVSPAVFDAAEVKAMADQFERYFERGERYAVLSLTPRAAPAPEPRERKAIAEWANHPRIRDFSKRLCVGTATVTLSPVARAALSVIMAIWKPAAPFQIASSVEQGLDYCLKRIHEERLAMSKPLDLVRYEMLRLLDGAV